LVHVAASASEAIAEELSRCVGEDKLQWLVPPIFETPTRWHCEPLAMALAQVVRMGVALANEIVEPCH
jgi:hypothetical protein